MPHRLRTEIHAFEPFQIAYELEKRDDPAQWARGAYPPGPSGALAEEVALQAPCSIRTADAPGTRSDVQTSKTKSEATRRDRLNRSGLRMLVERDLGDAELMEAHHRMKNEMQLIVSAMAMRQRARAAEALPWSQDCSTCMAQVLSVARLHDTLLQGSGHDKVDLGAFLPGICVQFAETFGLGSQMQMEIEISSGGAACSGRKAGTIALIINEALTNALKHGRPASGSGHIRVSVKLAQETARIEVRNDRDSVNAPGLEPPRVIAALTQQIGGTAHVDVSMSQYALSCRIPLG